MGGFESMEQATDGASRRNFLNIAVGAGVAALLPARALAAAPERSLRFYNTHTGEFTSTTYWADGQFIQEGLQQATFILRDFRNGAQKAIDPGLLDLLVQLRGMVGSGGASAFHIISGYRSPQTNALLRESTGGVARHSMHLEARAIDIRMPGIALDRLRAAAIGLQGGGVGFYPDSNFVHVDTGRVRTW